jgi:DNA-binding LytR/AlgR family response regulator
MKIKVLIVDDEPHAIEVIENYLSNFSEVEIVATCQNGIEAFKVLQQKNIDLMFLDIQMPGIKGTDLVKSLKKQPRIIFTTAFAEYAVEGFELEAVDYLIKPISFDRFLRSMDKVLRHFGAQQQIVFSQQSTLVEKDTFLYLKVDRKMMKIAIKDILWIESQKDYIKVVLQSKELVSKQKISLIEELLPEDEFVRIHRSFIVSISKIDSYYSYAVEINNKELPIGRNYKAETQKKLKMIY